VYQLVCSRGTYASSAISDAIVGSLRALTVDSALDKAADRVDSSVEKAGATANGVIIRAGSDANAEINNI
jgi:hypothetical protein